MIIVASTSPIYVNVVVGFFKDSFSGVEQGPGHSVQVGYKKGADVARQNLRFTVQSTPGTASRFVGHVQLS